MRAKKHLEEEQEIKDFDTSHLKKSIKVIPPKYTDDEVSILCDIIFNLKQIPQPEQRIKTVFGGLVVDSVAGLQSI